MQIQESKSIRKLLTTKAVKLLVQSTVIVCLANCYSLYDGLPMKLTKRLQLAHSSAARLITLSPRFELISPMLKQLHCLPIHKRCQFKILVFVYKTLHTDEDIFNSYQPPRLFRSASTTSLVPNKTKLLDMDVDYWIPRQQHYGTF